MRYSEMKAQENERDWRRAIEQAEARPPLRIPAWVWALVALGLVLILASCGSSPVYRDTSVSMTTNGPVELPRYAGKWFEIARYPNSFEEGCVGVTAEYDTQADGTISVLNTCRQGAFDGPVDAAEGVATIASDDGDRLRVSFVPWLPFAAGDYWILYTDYQISVVGTPSGSFGWILARTPQLEDADLQRAFDILQRNGYDLSQIYLTPQG